MIILTVIPICLWPESTALQAGFRLKIYRNDKNDNETRLKQVPIGADSTISNFRVETINNI